MRTINRKQIHASSGGALLAGAVFLAALAVAAPGEAFAACVSGGASTGASAGTNPASSGGGGIYSGASASAGSSGGGASSCGVNAAATGGALTPSLAGVHTGVIMGNGMRTTGALSRTVTTARTATTASTANTVHPASGTPHTHFVPAGKHP